MTRDNHPVALTALFVSVLAVPIYFGLGVLGIALTSSFAVGSWCFGACAAAIVMAFTIIVVSAREGWLSEASR